MEEMVSMLCDELLKAYQAGEQGRKLDSLRRYPTAKEAEDIKKCEQGALKTTL